MQDSKSYSDIHLRFGTVRSCFTMGVVQSTAAAVSPTIQRAAAATSAAVFRTEQYKPLEEPKTVIDFEEKKSCFDKYKSSCTAR